MKNSDSLQYYLKHLPKVDESLKVKIIIFVSVIQQFLLKLFFEKYC